VTLPPLDLDRRAGLLAEHLDACGLDAMLVVSRADVRWATGFTGSAGIALVTADRIRLVTDGRYAEQGALECPRSEVVLAAGAPWTTASETLRCAGSVGLDPAHVSLAEWRMLCDTPGVQWRQIDSLLAPLRRRKDPAEIARIELAASIADSALRRVATDAMIGATEAEIRDALEAEMRALGADGPSYDTIVASGPNAALPHHRPSRRRVCGGDAVVIDVGALVEGYHSDMTRTFLPGEPDEALLSTHRLVGEAQAAGVSRVAPGVEAAEVDEACRSVFRDAGREGDVVHGTGHGVGLLIHEPPWLRRGSVDTLAEGDVLTVEPGLYRVGRDGVRIEDLLVVTADGCRTLTLSTKDPTCPPSRRTT
jgi:Xaa-Pro aminopeptidase